MGVAPTPRQIGVPILSVITLTAWMCGCACEYDNEGGVTSPDGRYVISLYYVNCGATMDFSSVVSIRRSDEASEPGRTDGDLLVLKGQYPVTIKWSSNGVVSLGGISGARYYS